MNGPPRLTVKQDGRQALTLLLDGELTIGRDCEGLLLPDPQVSRRHIMLRPSAVDVEVIDLDSTNGTYLNSARVLGPQAVREDAQLLVGDTTLHLEIGGVVGRGGVEAAAVGTSTTIRTADDLRSTSIEMVADLVSSSGFDGTPDLMDGDTMTILFSDIESSTERATSMGDEAWFALLEEHNAVFHDELERFGGREIKSMGDGFMLTFTSVRRALRFACAVQNRVEAKDGPDLRVRMGLHTGEAIADGSGDLFGRHVNLAARVANLAVGGQILTSLVVREIAFGRGDTVFGEPAEAVLKGFAELQTVYEFLWAESELS